MMASFLQEQHDNFIPCDVKLSALLNYLFTNKNEKSWRNVLSQSDLQTYFATRWRLLAQFYILQIELAFDFFLNN